jgi:hypothetical protein
MSDRDSGIMQRIFNFSVSRVRWSGFPPLWTRRIWTRPFPRRPPRAERPTKTAYILDALDEKLGLRKSREQKIRDLAGFLSHTEVESLRGALQVHSARGSR